jgi:hypothetical protein
MSTVPLAFILVACAGAATWTHDPDDEIGPETTSFTAWVTETSCAGGEPSTDRVIGPDIEVTSTSIVVTFRVSQQLGLGNTCPGNPATPVRVTLPAPLGDRALLDGGREPAEAPPVCQARDVDGPRYCN